MREATKGERFQGLGIGVLSMPARVAFIRMTVVAVFVPPWCNIAGFDRLFKECLCRRFKLVWSGLAANGDRTWDNKGFEKISWPGLGVHRRGGGPGVSDFTMIIAA